jgi:hypothetical protein
MINMERSSSIDHVVLLYIGLVVDDNDWSMLWLVDLWVATYDYGRNVDIDNNGWWLVDVGEDQQ